MRILSFLTFIAIFMVGIGTQAHAGIFDSFFSNSPETTQVFYGTEASLMVSKTKLQEEVSGGQKYIERIEVLFESIKEDTEKLARVQDVITEMKQKSDNGTMSKDASILVDYLYYYTLSFQEQAVTENARDISEKSIQPSEQNEYYEEDCYEYNGTEYCDIYTDTYEYYAYEDEYYYYDEDDYEYEDYDYDDYYEDDYYDDYNEPVVRTLEDFPTPSKPWSNEFQMSAPKTGFAVVYFNTETREKNNPFYTDRISLTEAWSVGDIDPVNDLGAYIIGNITIEEDGIYEFSVAQSWAQTRIILNDKIVFGEGNSSVFRLELKKGTYKMEVEYINNWHTVELLVNYYKPMTAYSVKELVSEIPEQKGEVWYVGIYEPDADEHEVILNIPKTSQNISLVLSSYSPANWIINNPHNSNVRDVIFQSYEPGTTVLAGENTKIYKLKDAYYSVPSIYDTKPDCHDYGHGEFYCEGGMNEFDNLNATVEEIYGKKLTGFAGDYYGTQGFILPGKVLDAAGYKKIEEEYQELLEMKKKAEEKKNFNNMFD